MADDKNAKLSDHNAGGEALCRRCGLCCHEKIRIGEQVIITDIPCRHLDTETNLCRIYDNRAELEPRCLSAAESAKGFGLPGDCPYVAGISNYQEPHLLREHPEYEKIVDILYPERAGGKNSRKT
jgi:uncharacterized cysteine cluster protein YcgN (CxxCxxCC family)